MKIETIVLREIAMDLKAPFETSFGVIQKRRILLVELVSEGISGWGEVTTLESPTYNSETTETAWHIISDFIAPLLLGQDLKNASEVATRLAGIRGHHMAKAGVENAFWDIEAQREGLPLARLLGGTLEQIACGVSITICESTRLIVKRVEEELRRGYQRIKLKIKPGKDLDFVAAVREEFREIQLSVDANSAYDLNDAERLKVLDAFNLLMIEQPLQWDDIHSHAKLQTQINTAICLDECINNATHARTAIELGACRIINIKSGRVGGHSAARQIHDVCWEHSLPVWCGGMLESGVGRAHNIALSTLPDFTLPGDVSASSRYWDEDIIEPDVEVASNGTIRVPATPGLGYAVKRDMVDRLTARARYWQHKTPISAAKLVVG